MMREGGGWRGPRFRLSIRRRLDDARIVWGAKKRGCTAMAQGFLPVAPVDSPVHCGGEAPGADLPGGTTTTVVQSKLRCPRYKQGIEPKSH
ncbi:hypothetical protein FA13DRAFT_165276 [Coprinellus micaceus]|uniref:Uncharacterized protein n=1 Tax=Coprinellus micaceus TaxID=71717 RepID=A0A4Y7SH96_COPMI|nr:hypothetical protein FA13DRAFT_165276 [Coprinellus micaceus]